jgi:hypothetical protein
LAAPPATSITRRSYLFHGELSNTSPYLLLPQRSIRGSNAPMLRHAGRPRGEEGAAGPAREEARK